MQAELDFSRKLRDEGIERAVSRAERHEQSWGSKAYAFLLDYAKRNEFVVVWMARKEAENTGAVAEPPNKRAWGGPVMRLLRAGVIEETPRRVQNPDRHATKVTVYRSLVYRGPWEIRP